MAFLKKHPQAVRLSALVALGVHLLGCAQWREEPIAPQSQPVFDSTQTYRVLLATGQRPVIEHPHVTADSVIWVVHSADGTFPPPKRYAISRADVRDVEVEKAPSTLGTIVVLFVGIAGLVGMLGGGSVGWSTLH